MTTEPGIVIVGAGHAGGRAAQALRQAGFPGPVTLVGEETWAPNERPPRSKELLVNDKVNVISGFGLTPLAMVTAPLATQASLLSRQRGRPTQLHPLYHALERLSASQLSCRRVC